jgi:hypothetical protein
MAVISGGTTLIDNGTLDAAVPAGKMTLISEQTASSSATISFTSGIDSTYDSYVFKYIECNPATNATNFEFNLSTDGGSNYNVTKTSTHFWAYHKEDDTTTSLDYWSGGDLAQGTGDQYLSYQTASDADAHVSGTLQIFNPSSTTFVKHYIARSLSYWDQNAPFDEYVAGYGNTTSAINAVQFSFSSGNFDGTIKMYGIGG